MREFRMPQLGADMAAGTLVEWLRKPGDRVAHGDIIAVVETDKGAIEVEVFDDGTIAELKVIPGTKVPVGTVLATLDGDGEGAERKQIFAAPEPPARPEPATVASPPAAPREAPPSPARGAQAPTAAETRIRISPVAARHAAQYGIDIKTLRGTGPDRAVRLADVEAALSGDAGAISEAVLETPLETPTETMAETTSETPADAMRRAIAAAMGRSKREIPHYYLSTRIDLRRMMDWLATANEARPVTERLLYSVPLIKAVARAIDTYPEFSGFWKEDRFVSGDPARIGWAVSLRGGGLVAPALPDVSDMNPDAVMTALRDLVKRARSYRLRSSELSAPTLTVTNLGDQGVETVFGVIYPPQVALVGFGSIYDEVLADDSGQIAVRPAIRVSLAADHRASDGHRGGLFLKAVDGYLQEPETL